MEFGRSIDPFIKWFFICGLNCYPSFDGFLFVNSRKNRFVYFIPTVGLLALVIAIGCFAFFVVPMYVAGEFLTYMLCVYTLIPVLAVLVCTIPIIFLSRYSAKICSQINSFERLSQKKFSIDPKAFRRRFMRRVHIILITFIMPTLFTLFVYDIPRRITMVSILSMRVLVTMASMHSFFYIDLLDYLLQRFVRHTEIRAASTESPANVQTINICGLSAHEVLVEISQYKLLHFHLWKLSRNINKLFGWTNVAIILHNFLITIVYTHSLKAQIFLMTKHILGKFRDNFGKEI